MLSIYEGSEYFYLTRKSIKPFCILEKRKCIFVCLYYLPLQNKVISVNSKSIHVFLIRIIYKIVNTYYMHP